jgi:TonB family protein
MRAKRALAAILLALALPGTALLAQEEPLAAGADGVPLPKKTKHVQPSYPAEALAQGVRGIVILDVVVSSLGKVESTSIVRSVPGLDEAAIAAARQWEYEPVKVDGKPVRVRVTVPVVFSLALPQLARQDGIPELRQGVSPAWPAGASGGGLVTAEVTLEPDGRVGVAQVLDGGAPWSGSLLAALKTWRFSPPPEEEVQSFRVEAEFVTRGSEQRIQLRASGLQRSGLLAESAPAPAPAPVPQAPAPVPQAPAPVPQAPAGPAAPPAGAPAAAPVTAPAPTPAAAPAPAAESPVPTRPSAARAAAGEPRATDPPPVEVITAPLPAAPPENGVSAIRDVTLEPGVPDLARGRRPVSPPLARMTGTTGTVEVSFSVSAGGVTSLQGASGPEMLRPAAEQAVSSWVFRRARADRAYLLAVFTYAGDKTSAVVRPQPAPPAAAAPAAPPGS